jgi:hypothetical protein
MKGFAFLSLTLALATSGFGQEGPRTELDEARLALTNVLVQEVKSGRQATFSLKWDYLPESRGLKEQFLNVFTFDGKGKLSWEHEYTLPNEILRDPTKLNAWFTGLKDRETLSLALSAGTNRNARSLDEAIQAGLAQWDKSLFVGLGFSEGQGSATVPWNNYITSKRDFFAMRALLKETRGAGAVIEFNPAPRGQNPLLVSNGLVWRIRVFPLPTSTDKPLYRFSVSIQSKPMTKLWRGVDSNSEIDKPKLNVTVGLLKEDVDAVSQRKIYRMAKISLAKDGSEVETKPVAGADQLKEPESTLSPSTGATSLAVFTGSTAQGLLAPLIANNSEAQIFTGGLIGQGGPTNVYGLNYTFTERTDGNLGFLYAFVPKADSGLYLGPSISFGPFIASVGAQFFNTLNNTVSTRWAGTLSIDLSKVFGRSSKPIQLNPRLVREGSEIWADTDKLFENQTLVLCRVQGPSEAPLIIKQVRDASGSPIDGPAVVATPGSLQRLVLPRGYFTVMPPQGFEVSKLTMMSEAPAEVPADLEYRERQTLTTVRNRPEAVIFVVRTVTP